MMDAFRALYYAGRCAIRPLSEEAALRGLKNGWVERRLDETSKPLGYSMTERGRQACREGSMWAARPVRDMLAEAGIDEREAVKRLTRWIKALPKERRAFPCAHEGETTQSYIRRYYVENALRYVGGPRGYTYSGEWPC